MTARQNIVALIFDFDDTLTDDSVTSLLESRGVDVDKFWEEGVGGLVGDGWDPPLAYMRRMIELTEPGQALHGLTNSELKAWGSQLRPYPGLQKFFRDVQEFVQSTSRYRAAGIRAEFFMVSGGLQEIIEGFKIRSVFAQVWGSSFFADPNTGAIRFPKNAITFTDKTRFLFQISKGLVGPEVRTNPDAVNRDMAEEERPVPFRNMIYVGDGLTDIPCFSVVEGGSGHAFGISQPGKPDKERRKMVAWNLLSERRTKGVYAPHYGKGHSLRYVLDTAVEQVCNDVVLWEKTAL